MKFPILFKLRIHHQIFQLEKSNFVEGVSYGKRFVINLALVYFLQYTINSGLCERVNKKNFKSSDFFKNIQ